MSVESRERIAVRAIIITENNQILLGKRGRGIGEGQYAFVGGKRDEGETMSQAVRREIKEEVGLNLKNLVLWKSKTYDKTIPGEKWRTYYFIANAEGEISLKIDEVPEVIAIDRRNFENLDIAFDHREVLEEFFGLK